MPCLASLRLVSLHVNSRRGPGAALLVTLVQHSYSTMSLNVDATSNSNVLCSSMRGSSRPKQRQLRLPAAIFSSLIQSEVADMKDSKRKRLFEFHNTGISGLLYLIMDKEAGIYRQPSVLLHAASWLRVITIA